MELSSVADELYGLPLREFTAARNQRASEARSAGQTELAELLTRLRKPSTGAAVANLLVREQPREIERLIKLGATLRSARTVEGDRIRRATKEKAEIVSNLLREAMAIAKRAGLPFSQSTEQELEATLDAAFADSDSAQSLREGRLTTALHYSGLGFGVDAKKRLSATRSPGKGSPAGADIEKAKHKLEQAQREAKQAATEVDRARRAVKAAEVDLQRLRAALTVATRRTTKANERESDAQSRLDHLRGKRSRS